MNELAKKYTSIKPCIVDGEPDAHTTQIKIGNQSFRIDGYQETKEEAEWMCEMLGKAFKVMIEANSSTPKVEN